MPSRLVPELSAEEASYICMNQCKAQCCQGPLLLELAHDEVDRFLSLAEGLKVEAKVSLSASGAGWLKFAEHPSQKCPMLEPETNACRIYDARPARCREFPWRKTPGCAISGG